LQTRNDAFVGALISLALPLQVVGEGHRLAIRAIEEQMLLCSGEFPKRLLHIKPVVGRHAL
jgi:hypothetical protein